MVRFGVTPEINALATILVVMSITVVVVAARTVRTERRHDQNPDPLTS